MGDPDFNSLIVRDVSTYPGRHGLAMDSGETDPDISLGNIRPRHYAMDFSIVDTVFRTTGPVTLSVSINGHPLGTIRCDRPGDFHFEKAVPPPGWLAPSYAVVEASVDKFGRRRTARNWVIFWCARVSAIRFPRCWRRFLLCSAHFW